MPTMLVATDLSPRADRALDRALILARAAAARLVILHVVDDRASVGRTLRREAAARRAIETHLNARGQGVAAEPRLRVGAPAAELLAGIAAAQPDLVIIGAHREGGEDSGAGLVAWRVLLDAAAPVLLVRDPAFHAYRKAVIGFDFSGCSAAALRAALELRPQEAEIVHAYAPPLGALVAQAGGPEGLRALHARELDAAVDAALAEMPETLTATPIVRRVEEGDPLAVLAAAPETMGAELVAIGTRGRDGVAGALFGGVAKRLLRSPPADVLAVKGG